MQEGQGLLLQYYGCHFLKQAFATVEPSLFDNQNIVIENDKITEKQEELNGKNIKIKNINELKSIINKAKNLDKFYFNILTEKNNLLSFSFLFNNSSYFIEISQSSADLFNVPFVP